MTLTRLYSNLISFITGLPLEHPLSSIINTSLSTPLANIFYAPLSTHLDLLSRKKKPQKIQSMSEDIYILYIPLLAIVYYYYYRELKDNHNKLLLILLLTLCIIIHQGLTDTKERRARM